MYDTDVSLSLEIVKSQLSRTELLLKTWGMRAGDRTIVNKLKLGHKEWGKYIL